MPVRSYANTDVPFLMIPKSAPLVVLKASFMRGYFSTKILHNKRCVGLLDSSRRESIIQQWWKQGPVRRAIPVAAISVPLAEYSPSVGISLPAY